MKAHLVVVATALAVPALLVFAATQEVKISGSKFGPATITVAKGDTVTWTNSDAVPHTATAAGKFDSGTIAPGKSVSKKMDQAGEFDYICSFHPAMKGKLVVK
jgi:plastocyanin